VTPAPDPTPSPTPLGTPYYQDADTTLYKGDCREVLAAIDLTADLMVTDPPYGQAYRSNRGQHAAIAGDDGSLAMSDWLPAALKRVRRGRHVYIFGARDTDITPDMNLCGMTELIWDKQIIGMGDLSMPWSESHEPILFGVQEISKANRAKNYGVGAARLRKGSVLSVQRSQSGQNKRHPTEKPVDLLRILIESSSTFGEVVLDPFAGSGSTLVAARMEGRRSVGVELDEGYCDLIATRLTASGLAQGVLL
jgi:site-specific DNA-methyltransferase (adenine-specific)